MKIPYAICGAIAVLMLTSAALANSSHSVRGYVTKKGAYVQSHKATDPNKTKRDNWSKKGNVNPNTGKNGQKY